MKEIMIDQKEAEGILDAYGRSCGRRNFIGLAGAAAAGYILTAEEAKAGIFGFSSKEVAGIPKSWVRLKGNNVNRYANYIQGLRLRNITPRMVLAPHFKTRSHVVNNLPPRRMWKKIGPTLKVVDRVSREMGLPVRSIISAYRSPRYNWAVHGKSGSQHKLNKAIDVQFYGASPRHVASVARFLRKKRKFEGGVGVYNSFVHIDTRGYNADW